MRRDMYENLLREDEEMEEELDEDIPDIGFDDTYAIWEDGSDPICPKCGSGNLTTTLRLPPVLCRACGWRGYMPEEEEE